MNTPFLTKPITALAQNRRAGLLAFIYAALIAVSFYLAYEVRFDFVVPADYAVGRLQTIWIVIAVKLVALVLARQLGTMLTYFSVPDFLRLMVAMVASSIVLLFVRMVGAYTPWAIPRGVLLIDFMTCSGALCSGRLAARIFRERVVTGRNAGTTVVQQQRIAIVGAGDAGASLAREFLTNPSRGFRPVVFFDDDRNKHGKLVHGISVMGRPEVLRTAKGVASLSKVIIAMPTAPAKRIREVVQLLTELGLKAETLPSIADLAAGRVKASRIRPVEVEDLLGREAVDLDSEGIRASIQGRVVLVTGAGGSIGSELCRQIAALAPTRLLLVEQSEGALFLIEQELNELGLGSLAVPLVGDILDEERMRYIFAHYRPATVFHAAAHKHVYMMERQPVEAIRNNVLGTRQLAEIAADYGVERFVLISTDKAINPTNVMGATKRLAELQLLAVAAQQEIEAEQIANGHAPALHSLAGAESETHAAAALLRAVGHAGAQAAQVIQQELTKAVEAAPVAKQIGFGAGGAATRNAEMLKSWNAEMEPTAAGGTGPTVTGKAVPSERDSQPTLYRANATDCQSDSGQPSRSGSSSEISDSQHFSISAFPTARSERRTKFMAVRFGNVLGSSGSVIPIFKRQIANGGPVTVTHPDVTRYFMTIPEAVGLVMQASILGNGGEIFVLDMGQPVKIVDLAKQMIELSGFKVGDDIEIKFSGLKPGEKLFEELQHKNEQHTPTEHPRIMRFTSNAMISESGVQELRQRLYELDSNQLKHLLQRLVPEYVPFLD